MLTRSFVWVLLVVCASGQPRADRDRYLFASFRGNGDGLHLAWSEDGLAWTPLDNDRPYLTPEIGGKLMRDPFILRARDGTFHMVWTTGWWDRVIGYASSKDLMHWSAQRAIPVMEHEPAARNAWAPEIAYDSARDQFLIFWSTTIPGRFSAGETAGDRAPDGTMLNHRIYATTTRDFVTFTPTTLLFDPGFSVIDATILTTPGTVYLVFKDETRTPPKKHLRLAAADRIEGPYAIVSEPFTPSGVWVEGPSVVKIGEFYYCYFDMYQARRYGAMRSTDLKTWEDVTAKLRFTVDDVRHGTAFTVGADDLSRLMSGGSR